MVANKAKPIAFQYPMESAAIDLLWNDFEKIAKDYGVHLYREKNLPSTLLFPSKATLDKEVVIIYDENRLNQYQQWKRDINKYKGADFQVKMGFVRRLGRLLGYSPKGVNSLLRKNSNYRDLASFGITQQITHLYYEDMAAAKEFYSKTIGLPQKDSTVFQISKDGYIALHALNEDHPKGQPKSTAIALLTNQLPQWYKHLQTQKVPIKYPYKPKEGGPHDGFVAIDTGGYLLEFEEFKQHPENEFFMAVLGKAPKIETKIPGLNFIGTITWTYHKDLLKMQELYETIFGYEMVADQGWTKIYRTAPNSFIGLVDERRGMENYAPKKAVELEWKLNNHQDFSIYAKEFWTEYNFTTAVFKGPELYHYLMRNE